MNKYINADELKKALYHLEDWEKTETKYVSLSLIYRAINEEPAADVVEIVRCKDCKKQNECGLYVDSEPEWFCADGERRESNE